MNENNGRNKLIIVVIDELKRMECVLWFIFFCRYIWWNEKKLLILHRNPRRGAS